jgi:hypothetical protein
MNASAYREPQPERLYLCPQCHAPAQGPVLCGPAACSRCGRQVVLPSRASLAGPSAGADPNDPGRLAQLRVQDGRPRMAPPSLAAVLGGQTILPGREQEALLVWQTLRQRAEASDPAASEDLAFLTLLLAQHPAYRDQAPFVRALLESALDASVLPRHKQEQLGTLCRRAIAEGRRDEALRFFHAMDPMSVELTSDSQYRLSAAAISTLDRDGQRVLWAIGARKDAVPIADAMDAMASIFRANAFELLGDVASAQQVLRELPSAELLTAVQGRFPHLSLCARAAAGYQQSARIAAGDKAAQRAGAIGKLVGFVLIGSGLFTLFISVVVGAATGSIFGAIMPCFIAFALVAVGAVLVVRAKKSAEKARWLAQNGLALRARIVNAELTGTRINHVPLMRFHLQVHGPQGPYAASFTQLAREHEVALLLGKEIGVRANPQALTELIVDPS